MLPPKGTIKNLGHASRGRRPKSAGAIKARTKAAKMAEQQAQALEAARAAREAAEERLRTDAAQARAAAKLLSHLALPPPYSPPKNIWY